VGPTVQDVVMPSPSKRPAHRPSRRALIVAAALELIAENTPDTVTIANIAVAAQMTSAAIYYHYPSREAILLEGFQNVSQTYRAAVRRGVARTKEDGSVRHVPREILEWAQASVGARAYVLSASGLSSSVEAVLRDDRIYAVLQLRQAVRAIRPGVRPPQASILAVALLSLVETALSSSLHQDGVRRSVSRTRFREEVEELAELAVLGDAAPGQ